MSTRSSAPRHLSPSTARLNVQSTKPSCSHLRPQYLHQCRTHSPPRVNPTPSATVHNSSWSRLCPQRLGRCRTDVGASNASPPADRKNKTRTNLPLEILLVIVAGRLSQVPAAARPTAGRLSIHHRRRTRHAAGNRRPAPLTKHRRHDPHQRRHQTHLHPDAHHRGNGHPLQQRPRQGRHDRNGRGGTAEAVGDEKTRVVKASRVPSKVRRLPHPLRLLLASTAQSQRVWSPPSSSAPGGLAQQVKPACVAPVKCPVQGSVRVERGRLGLPLHRPSAAPPPSDQASEQSAG